MKRILSLILAVSLLFSVCSVSFNAYSASKAYAEDKLVEIEKITGFIPGKTAAVTGNCYAFIAKVCEKLYGVSYNGEGLYDNYKAKHSSGNFYTVSTYTTSHTSPTAQDVEDIIAFFLKYAAPGDVVHYGAYNKGYSKTHTVMIQSISNKKMSVLHSNYQIAQNSKDSCHVDDIYWDSFRENPTKHIKNADGTLYSLNAMFYNTMKDGRGLGITINRYSKYEDKFYLVGACIPTVKTERTSPTSIKVKWDEIIGATKYKVDYKKSSSTSYTTLSSGVKDLFYEVKGLTVGTTYNFRVAAYIGEKWMDCSDVVSRQALPPTLTVIKFTPESNGLKLSWTKRNDITGIRIYKSTSATGTFSKIKTITDNSVGTYLDKSITYGKTYYYKIERYCKSGSDEYKTTSSAIAGSYTLSTPDITYKNTSATTIEFSITANGASDYFNYYATDSSSKNVVALTKTTQKSITLSQLTPGEKYTFKCRQATSLGSGDYASITVTAIPKKEEIRTVSATANGVKVRYSLCSDVDGYKIYRSTAKDGSYSLIGTVDDKNTETFTDATVAYNTSYYYKVCSFVKNGSKNICSEYSEPSSAIKITLEKPEGASITRKTPTSVTMKWSAVKNANKYIIQYKEEGKSWNETTSNSTSKVISGLKLGAVYYYKVKAANDIGSGSFCAQIEKKTLPPTPAAPTLSKSKSGVKITWKAKDWTTGYKIYRATSKDGTYKLIKTVSKNSTTSFTDKDVTKNKTYYYKTVCYVTKDKKDYLSPKSPYSYIKFTV